MSNGLVDGYGPDDADILILGDKPGKQEVAVGEVYCGKPGAELDNLMWKYRVPKDRVYLDNLLEDAPTGEDWSVTDADIRRNDGHINNVLGGRQWSLVVAAGPMATRLLLGSGVRSDLPTVHAIPHEQSIWRDRRFDVFPIFSPASGMHDSEEWVNIAYDFGLLGRYIRGQRDCFPNRVDDSSRRRYEPLTNRDTAFIRHYFERKQVTDLYVDTEGSAREPWCTSWNAGEAGTGYVIRSNQLDALSAFAQAIQLHRPTVWMHYAVHDIPVLRALGIGLVEHGMRIRDTMVMAYLLQVEPQGLKNLAWRNCGMGMSDYMDLVGPHNLEKRVDYLLRVAEVDWGKPEAILLEEKMETRVTQPQGLNTRINKILKDIEDATEPAEDVDLWKRWNDIHPTVRENAEQQFGPMPSGNLDDLDFETAKDYAACDADATRGVRESLEPRLRDLDLWKTLEMDCNTIPMIEEMQTVGFKADAEYFERLRVKWRGEQGKMRWKIRQQIGYAINPESDPQVRQLLFVDRRLPSIKKTDSGAASTNDKAIDWMKTSEKIKPADRELVTDIGRSREYEKGVSSFAEPIRDYALADANSRIHTNIKYTRVVSGRYSATEPNLLAMPVRSDLGKDIRNGFVARAGCLLGSWDLNQIEMRFLAHESQDATLIADYYNDKDVHAETAISMFGRYDKELRDAAKRTGFGVITGITGAGLKDQFWLSGITKFDEDACDEFIKLWFAARPGAKQYLEACRAEARRDGCVRESVGGRMRYLQGVYALNRRVAAEHERASHSHKISSGAQAYIKLCMDALRPMIDDIRGYNGWPQAGIDDIAVSEGRYVRWVLQVHDELIFEFSEGLETVLDTVIKDALCNTVKLRVPVKAEGKWAKSWGKLK